MINKKMIPGIIIFVILIVIIIVIIYNYNKKKKENKENSDKLQQCQQQCNSKLQQSNQQVQQCNSQLQQHKPQLKDSQLTISNLQKEIKANKFKLYKARYHSGEFQRTKLITLQLLESLAPDLKVGLGKGYTGKPLLGGVQETLEEYIADQKADQKAGSAAKHKTEMTEMTIGVLKALYEAFDDNFDTQSCLNLLKTVGMDALNLVLATAGLGWLSGPLNALVKDITGKKQATQPNLFTADQLTKILNQLLANYDITKNLNAIQVQLNNVANFLQNDYPNVKKNNQALCSPNVMPPSATYCPPQSPPNSNKCDFVQQNNNLQGCFINSNIAKGYPYDPSIVSSYKGSAVSGTTKRLYLTNFLGVQGSAGASTSPIFMLINGPILNAASNGNAASILDTLYTATSSIGGSQIQCMVSGYPLYIYIIIYTISYYQELALVDTNLPTTDKSYSNPYVSSNISKMYSTLNSLLSFPQTNKGFMSYIFNIFKCYYNQLTFNTNKNDCCGPIPANLPGHCCTHRDPNDGWCDEAKSCENYTSINDGFAMLNTVDPKSKRNWYQLISEKYNDNYYSPIETISIIQDDQNTIPPSAGDAQSVMTKYLAYFNEYLNFPFDTYLNFAKMAGYTPQTTITINGVTSTPTPTTSSDLFTYMLTLLYADNRVPITKPLPKISITFPALQDASGGYPFGLDKPSYTEALAAVNNFNTTPTLKDIDRYNTYGTPAYSIEPGASFDATMFNIPGDINFGSYSSFGLKGSNSLWVCDDGLADNIRSALLPGASPGYPGLSPGKTDSATPNSRQTYCINTKTGKLSNLQPYNPNQNYGPSSPAAGKIRVWQINANNQLYRLQSTGGHISIDDAPVLNWNNSGGSSTWNFNKSDGTTFSLVFDSNSYIIDGNISLFQPTTTPGPSTTPGPYTPPIGTARPWSTTPGPTTTPSKSGSITNLPVKWYDANMPLTPAAGTFKQWQFSLGGISYNLTLDSTSTYSLNGTPLPNFQNWNLSIVSAGTFSGIFGYEESLIYYDIGTNYSYTPVNSNSITIGGLPATPPAGSTKSWTTSDSGTKTPLTFSMDSNGNFILILGGYAKITLTGSFNMGFNYNGTIHAGGIFTPRIDINISGSLFFDTNGNLVSPSYINSSPQNSEYGPNGPLLPVAGVINTTDTINGNFILQIH
jgi:hypothetical protein